MGFLRLLLLSLLALSSFRSFLVGWMLVQWVPASWSLRKRVQEAAWQHWESSSSIAPIKSLQSPALAVLDVQRHLDDALEYLETTYGSDWRRRPLLLKHLWTEDQLQDSSRRLSFEGLLQENLTIPYFTDARLEGALAPDARGRVRDIVTNASLGAPHKIGTQFLVQAYPELVSEVAPTELVTELFGDYFTPERVQSTLGFLPALTTVPVFVASGKRAASHAQEPVAADTPPAEARPYTALHCEPIGNVAVQLSGRKRWTLVAPQYSKLIRPSTSPDGRAFFASWSTSYDHVPVHHVVTEAGDALWVPTWTWHRVDYIESEDMAIGASLFHFRILDYVHNNPLFAGLMIPAILLELVGYSTQ